MSVIDITEKLEAKRCKDHLLRGGTLTLVLRDEKGDLKKYKVTMKGKADDQTEGD